ncbi:MAG: hypothetical protein ACREQR_04990 [Candidatus Binataceae bacterium]
MIDERAEIHESEAFGMIAKRHRAAGLNLIATITGNESELSRAWIECDECAAVFELAGGGANEWALVEEEEASAIGPACVRQLAAAQA